VGIVSSIPNVEKRSAIIAKKAFIKIKNGLKYDYPSKYELNSK
jgi:hypothetical protein